VTKINLLEILRTFHPKLHFLSPFLENIFVRAFGLAQLFSFSPYPQLVSTVCYIVAIPEETNDVLPVSIAQLIIKYKHSAQQTMSIFKQQMHVNTYLIYCL
jgi:hypothetical protein